jgi:hypothetical protein
MPFATPAMQLEFWTELSALLTARDLRAPAPSTRTRCYLAIGTSLGKLVLTAPTADDDVACKLALNRAGPGGVPAAQTLHRSLRAEREAIERELGFHDLDWGSDRSETRVYRYWAGDVSARSEWPAAQAWLVDTAAGFARVFGPRLRALAEERGAEGPVRPPRDSSHGRARVKRASRHHAAKARDIAGRHTKRRSSIGWLDPQGGGEWVDERLQRFASRPGLELRTGTFPNRDRWYGVYSADEPDPAYRYAFGQWWGKPSRPPA